MRRYLVLGMAVLGAAVGYGATWTQATLYASTSTLAIVPQRVSEAYVPSGVTSDLQARLPLITLNVMTRTRLERLVHDFELYPEERAAGALMQDIIRRMRDEDIRISASGGGRFVIGFQNEDPQLAMRVTERLATFLVEENMRDREQQAESANQFLDSQLDDIRRRLNNAYAALVERRRDGGLMRSMELDVEALETRYRELFNTSEEAKVSANFERRQIGEQFRILEAARLPERPLSRGRGTPTAVGAAIGLLAGLGIAFRRPRRVA
jgi:uncharacterized protein involved in exopolysaccharide biosynthesis